MTDSQSHVVSTAPRPSDEGLFSGARRAGGYAERVDRLDEALPAVRGDQRPGGAGGELGSSRAGEEAAARSRRLDPELRPAPAGVAGAGALVAATGWRGRVVRATGGRIKVRAGAGEQAAAENVRVIRQATWTRSVSVVVANPKGGVGKTPVTILLAGALGWARGGYVAAWEGCDAAGSLTLRSEGDPQLGIFDLVEHAGRVASAGSLGAYTAPQTSHADVIGTVGQRPTLSEGDIAAARGVLETYYRITVVDTGDNPHSEAFGALIERADALVVPTLLARDSAVAALGLLDLVAASGAAGRELSGRAVVAVMHDGRPEAPDLAGRLVRALDDQARTVVDIPYDRHIAAGGELSFGSLSARSQVAWTQLAADVVRVMHPAI